MIPAACDRRQTGRPFGIPFSFSIAWRFPLSRREKTPGTAAGRDFTRKVRFRRGNNLYLQFFGKMFIIELFGNILF